VAQASNSWNGVNYGRFVNADYDTAIDQARLETDIALAAELFIKANDILIEEIAVVPLVNRAADKYAIATTLRDENIGVSDFENNYWNIANWNRNA
jgi:peptide/nickel transport system substrate-binding protein